MLEFLINLDQTLFYFINVSLANPLTDLIMPVVTSDMLLRIMYAVAIVLLLWKGDARVRWLVLFSGLVLLISDQTAAGYLKPLINRLRPCHTLENINLLVGCGGGKSMPSAHAANAFGQAVLFSYYFRKVAPYLVIFASLVALSRVFVGVHYPGDVIAGAVLGSIIGLSLAFGHRRFIRWRESTAVDVSLKGNS